MRGRFSTHVRCSVALDLLCCARPRLPVAFRHSVRSRGAAGEAPSVQQPQRADPWGVSPTLILCFHPILPQVLLLLESPYLEEDTEPGSVLHRLCALAASLSSPLRSALVRALRGYERDRFKRLVEMAQQLVSVHLMETGKVDDLVESGTLFLVRVFKLRGLLCESGVVCR